MLLPKNESDLRLWVSLVPERTAVFWHSMPLDVYTTRTETGGVARYGFSDKSFDDSIEQVFTNPYKFGRG